MHEMCAYRQRQPKIKRKANKTDCQLVYFLYTEELGAKIVCNKKYNICHGYYATVLRSRVVWERYTLMYHVIMALQD